MFSSVLQSGVSDSRSAAKGKVHSLHRLGLANAFCGLRRPWTRGEHGLNPITQGQYQERLKREDVAGGLNS